MRLQTVKQQWAEYSTAIWRGMGRISNEQVNETRQAFYAGAYSMLMAVQRIGNDDVSESDGVNRLEEYKIELESFHRETIQNHTRRN